jgi:Uma2 family endonuclease
MYGVSFETYEAFLAARGESSVPRMTYREGTLEIMSPSWNHENLKTTIARLLEVWALENDVDIIGVGSWTLKKEDLERGLEPDECYVLGTERKSSPDLAIEVNWTHGGLDKLEIYGKLGVPEVWLWTDGLLKVYRLDDANYVEAARSIVFPKLDLAHMASFLDQPSQPEAIRAYRAALRANG